MLCCGKSEPLGIISLIKLLLLFGVKYVLSFQPEFAEPIVNISVAVGRDATFTCQVRHLGGYRVGWVKADTKAIQAIHEHVITHNPRVSVSHSDSNTWNLHIKSVTEDDRGGYMCQLNTDPMKSQIGYLDVVIPPDFVAEDTSTDVIVPEGSSVKLTCRATGYPHPNVTWRREDGNDIILKDNTGTKQQVASFSGEVLKLTKLSRGEMGSYLCIASNGVPPSVSKRIILSIHFHPVINVRNQLVGSPFEKDVTIECNVEASPRSINYWIKDIKDGEMIVSSQKYHVQETAVSLYETRMMVTVRKFQKEDIGSYRCIAKNSLGEVDSSIRLYEIPDAKGHAPKHSSNVNELFKANKSRGKITHLVVAPAAPENEDDDDDGQPSSSVEDYDDDDSDAHNVFTKPTRTSSQNGGGYHHIHNANNNNHITNNNARYNNVPLFGNGGPANSNGAIVTHTDVRGIDNEVPTGIGSASHNCYSCCYYQFVPINLLGLVLVRLIS